MGSEIEKKVVNHYLKDEVPLPPTVDEIQEKLNQQFKEEEKKFLENQKISLKIKNTSKNQDPEYQKIGDSGFDLRANLDHHIQLEPLEREIVPTGLFFEIPKAYEVQIRPRSGMAAKQGIGVLNSPGTIDQDYRGEIKIILVNLSNETVMIEPGDRIAQAVLAPVVTKELVNITMVDEIDTNTERSASGFGSTGKS